MPLGSLAFMMVSGLLTHLAPIDILIPVLYFVVAIFIGYTGRSGAGSSASR